jgi:hypothetical protein
MSWVNTYVFGAISMLLLEVLSFPSPLMKLRLFINKMMANQSWGRKEKYKKECIP